MSWVRSAICEVTCCTSSSLRWCMSRRKSARTCSGGARGRGEGGQRTVSSHDHPCCKAAVCLQACCVHIAYWKACVLLSRVWQGVPFCGTLRSGQGHAAAGMPAWVPVYALTHIQKPPFSSNTPPHPTPMHMGGPPEHVQQRFPFTHAGGPPYAQAKLSPMGTPPCQHMTSRFKDGAFAGCAAAACSRQCCCALEGCAAAHTYRDSPAQHAHTHAPASPTLPSRAHLHSHRYLPTPARLRL